VQEGTDRVKEYVATRREEGAANGTINRELACLKRMFKLAYQSTPPKVARIPHIPMLEEHNVRSGFFSHEDISPFGRSCLTMPKWR
jgi:site-specific recombinase XerD